MNSNKNENNSGIKNNSSNSKDMNSVSRNSNDRNNNSIIIISDSLRFLIAIHGIPVRARRRGQLRGIISIVV